MFGTVWQLRLKKATRGLFAGAIAAFALGGPCLVFAQPAPAPLLHPLFADHAVLQRDRPIVLWGWTAPGAEVEAALAGHSGKARADGSGRWQLTLPALPAGGPHVLTVRAGGRSATVVDIQMGDVFLCSGQSNMELETAHSTSWPDIPPEGPGASRDNALRLFHMPRHASAEPLAVPATDPRWTLAGPREIADFSAVCYTFGRVLRYSETVPIGLIAASWGGTRIEAWMSDTALLGIGKSGAAALEAQRRINRIGEQHKRDPAGAERAYDRLLSEWWAANDPGLASRWHSADTGDAEWRPITADGYWEESGLQVDGLVWLRTDIMLTAEQAKLGGDLELGAADDFDTTYLNGRHVGSGGDYRRPRVYKIAPGQLRAGRNRLAVSVLDVGGAGGLPGAKRLRLANGETIALSGPWFARVARTAVADPPPPEPWALPNDSTAMLYNGMIAPLSPYGLRGVLWYQGESNAIPGFDADPARYRRLLAGLFADWRQSFRNSELPFLVVQLANYGAFAEKPQPHGWGTIREAQRQAVAADRSAALAVSIDLGDPLDIHPTQKAEVGRRLALAAQRLIYGHDVRASGPAVRSVIREGQSVRVAFDQGPLRVISADRPIAFELCNEARECRFAGARLEGPTIVLDGASAGDVFVRYCWGDAPMCNLYNDLRLPAVPFEQAIGEPRR